MGVFSVSMNGFCSWRFRRALVVVLMALAVALLGPRAYAAPTAERTVPRIDRKGGQTETLSSSGQFLAHGPIQADRAVLVTQAEEVREEVSRLLDRQDRRGQSAAVIPDMSGTASVELMVIHLWLQGDAQPRVQPRLYQVEGVPQPVLGVVVARATLAQSEDFRRELVRLLLVERVLRGQPSAAAGHGELLPAWLEIGVLEALDHVRAGRPSDRFAPLFAHGRILSVDDILSTRPATLEAGARDVFGASACCLVMALLEQPEGPVRFRRFLEAMPGRDGSWENLLVRQFPGMALSRHSLEKWWALQAAALATPDLLEPMTAAETDAMLARALLVRHRPGATSTAPSPVVRWLKKWVPVPSTPPAPAETPPSGEEELISLDELDRIAALPRRAEVLRANQGALAALLLRACPLHRPIIDEYQRVLGQLGLGKTAGLAARCEALAVRRRDVLATAEAATDLLNWYEATQRARLSGTFDRYFELLDAPAPPARGSVEDPISRSLDELEDEFTPLRD